MKIGEGTIEKLDVKLEQRKETVRESKLETEDATAPKGLAKVFILTNEVSTVRAALTYHIGTRARHVFKRHNANCAPGPRLNEECRY